MMKLWPYLLFWCCGTPFFATAQAVRPPVSTASTQSVQPHPIPASTQPIRATLTPAPATVLTIFNDSLLRNDAGITLDWQLFVNGEPRQKGAVPGLQLLPGRARSLHLPLKPPAAGDEAWLRLDFHGSSGLSRPTSGSRPALVTRFLPWQAWNADIRVPVAGELSFTDSNNIFTITSPTLHVSFDKETGWMRELIVDNYTLVTDTNCLRLNLPSFPHLQLFSTSTGSRMVIVRTEYTLPDQSWLLHLSYTFNSAGTLLVEETLEKDTTRADSLIHPLARLSMNLTLPRGIDSISWYGLTTVTILANPTPTGTGGAATNRTPTDADTIPTIHRRPLAAASAATAVRWLSARDHDGNGIQLMADSALPDTRIADPDNSILRIDEHDGTAPTQMRAVHRLAFKLTPLSITPRPAPTHPAPTRSVQPHPAPTKIPPHR